MKTIIGLVCACALMAGCVTIRPNEIVYVVKSGAGDRVDGWVKSNFDNYVKTANGYAGTHNTVSFIGVTTQRYAIEWQLIRRGDTVKFIFNPVSAKGLFGVDRMFDTLDASKLSQLADNIVWNYETYCSNWQKTNNGYAVLKDGREVELNETRGGGVLINEYNNNVKELHFFYKGE